jgi:hypothetical protein
MLPKFMKRSVLAGLAVMAAMIAAASDLFPAVKEMPAHPEMPDPLVTQAGERVTTPGQWQLRREEMKNLMAEYVYGHMPPPPGKVTSQEIRSGLLTNGIAFFRLVHLTFGESNQLGFDIRIFSPLPTNGVKAPFPTIVHPAFFDGDNQALGYTEALRRGYAVADIYYPQLGADETNYQATGFFPAYPGYDWNDIAAWAWGISRCVDFLETDPATDKSKIAVLGLSRLGQSAALAGALDDRIALVAQVGGGSAFRFSGKTRGGKQGLEDIVAVKPYWFGPRLPEFCGQVEKLPFDYHWLPALTAPRFYILCNGLDDQYVNGKAAVQTYLGAKPVYDFLGVPDHIGVNFRPGKHGMPASDWVAVMDFADQKLRGIDHHRTFDQIPPAEQLH